MRMAQFMCARDAQNWLTVYGFAFDMPAELDAQVPVHNRKRRAEFQRHDQTISLISRRTMRRPRVKLVKPVHKPRARVVFSCCKDDALSRTKRQNLSLRKNLDTD